MALIFPSLLGASTAPNATISWRVLLTYFQTGALSIVADVLLAACALAYLLGTRRLARRGRPWPRWQVGAFVVALLLVFIGIGSGLAAYDESNLPAHVVQHLFLMMVAPPLFALARPVTLLAQASERAVQVKVLKVVNSEAISMLTSPLSWALYYGTMWVYFVTPLFAISQRHPLVHDATHFVFVFVGYLFWQSIVGLDGARHRISPPMRLVALLIGAPLEAFLGLTIMSMARPIMPGYSLADTHDGGSVFWISSMLVMAVAAIVAMRQWVQSEERVARRVDRELARPGAPALSPAQLAELRRVSAPGRPQ